MSDPFGYDSADAANRVTAIELAPYLRGSIARFTLAANIAIGGTLTQAVTWDKVLPTAPTCVLITFESDDAGVLGGLLTGVVLKTPAKSTTGCSVLIKNTALVALGINSIVNVVALY